MSRFRFWILMMAAAWGVVECQKIIDAHFSREIAGAETLYFSDPAVIRRLCTSYTSLAADFYWLRTIQYYGGKDRSRPDVSYDLLRPLLKIVTTLDPQMLTVYRFGAIFLSEPRPVGAEDISAAAQFLDEGMEKNPDAWNLIFDKGFLYFWQRKDYNQAAEWFFRASRHPKAPPGLDTLARNVLGRQGDMETAEQLWRRQEEDAPHEKMRQNAVRNLKSLQFQRGLWTLEWITDRFYRQEGRFPASWEELQQKGWLKELPKDPFGESYRWDSQQNKVVTSLASKERVIPLPETYKKNFLSQLDQRLRQESTR